jgi:hypothetical protein
MNKKLLLIPISAALYLIHPFLLLSFLLILGKRVLLSFLPFHIIEFTTLSTVLFVYTFDLLTAVFLSFLIPSIVVPLCMHFIFPEFKQAREAPVMLNEKSAIDVLSALFAVFVQPYTSSFVYTTTITAIFKEILFTIRNELQGRPDYLTPLPCIAFNFVVASVFSHVLNIK